MADPTAADVHPAVAAVLAATPMIKDWSGTPCIRPIDAESIAARQAAAAIRWLVDGLRDADPTWGGSYDDDELSAIADEIEAQYGTAHTEETT